MKRILIILSMLMPFTAMAAKQVSIPEIVPMPQSITMEKGSCRMSGINFNCDAALDAKTTRMVTQFAGRLSLVSGKTSTVANPIGLARTVERGSGKGINFIKDSTMDPESYILMVTPRMVLVKAGDYNGFFYAIQTIKQMLPAAIYGTKVADTEKWVLPCCSIKDAPRFAYRGMHLDCSRHFFSTDEIKKYLDIMAAFKLNRFHWHLTDDQGWRFEVKKYPLLTEVGGYRNGTCIRKEFNNSDGIRYGGYYTQEQIRDIVNYADKLGITIVPEIDLPGHMLAAIAAYPELGCDGFGPFEVWQRWGISEQVICVGKESAMLFLEDVLAEVADVFPGEYIHIGGDECPKTQWKADPLCQAKIAELGLKSDENASAEARLQNYVTARMQKFLATKGKKIIGWDEVLEGELAKGATVMSWRGSKGGIKAAGMGYDVIMTPNTYCYFDYVQAPDIENEPFSISNSGKNALTMRKVYEWDPYDNIPEEAQHHILGVQANMWTEYIATNEHLEYMLLPRMFSLCEVQWCKPENKNFERLENSVKNHEFKILDIMGYNYRNR